MSRMGEIINSLHAPSSKSPFELVLVPDAVDPLAIQTVVDTLTCRRVFVKFTLEKFSIRKV
jgi:hypothetical protein